MATTQHDLDVVEPRGPVITTSRWQKAIGVAGLAVVVWVAANLFDTVTGDGLGPGGPGGHAPATEAPTTQPVGADDPPPDQGGVEHDPSQFDHP